MPNKVIVAIRIAMEISNFCKPERFLRFLFASIVVGLYFALSFNIKITKIMRRVFGFMRYSITQI